MEMAGKFAKKDAAPKKNGLFERLLLWYHMVNMRKIGFLVKKMEK